MGIQFGSASDKNHTVCIEQFFTDETLWNKAQITITGTGISIPTYHNTKFHYNMDSTEYYYTKTIVRVKKLTAVSHFLYYTTHIDNGNPPTPNHLPLYLVVYGIDSYLNDVDSSVYNLTPFELVGDKIQFEEDIDMNNNKIINLLPGTSDTDCITKKQMEDHVQSNSLNLPAAIQGINANNITD